MKNFITNLRKGHGSGAFTMIELLVVIAVIGVLAVAVLSSINPIEQINKGRDTRVRSNAAQLLNAADRFYAIQELYPWNDATYNGEAADSLPSIAFPDGVVCVGEASPAGLCKIGGVGYTAGDQEWLDGLLASEEVKGSYINAIENPRASNALFLFKNAEGPGVDDSVYICFSPSSNAFQLEAVTGCVERAASLPGSACANGPYDATSTYTDELICLP
jgi:prepilin-type N-terminal cleavage/methylation domain-containing protein